MAIIVLNVLGYCRSTVGGYDVWQPPQTTPSPPPPPPQPSPSSRRQLLMMLQQPQLQSRGVVGTTINRMNYQAAIDCLASVATRLDEDGEDEGEDDLLLLLRVGCYSVAGQLTGTIPVRRPHVRELGERVAALVLRLLTKRVHVRFEYAADLDPPRSVVGHCRPAVK